MAKIKKNTFLKGLSGSVGEYAVRAQGTIEVTAWDVACNRTTETVSM